MSPSRVTQALSWIIAVILALIPFHAFLTVWVASAVGHYTLLRLWKEILLLVLIAGALYLLWRDAALRKKVLGSTLAQFMALYTLVTLVWGAVFYLLHDVTVKALGYGLIVNLRFLLFFLVVWIIATKSRILLQIWPKLLLIPAAIVIVVGLIQRWLLPYDVLKHFGYSTSTIFPYETINHNINYPRIMSTLRGANPLGTYLILILAAIVAIGAKAKKKLWLWAAFGGGALLVLVFSYSRAAWIGFILSMFVLGWSAFGNQRIKRILLAVVLVLVVLGAGATWALHDNTTFQNVFLHTQENSAIKTTSNEGHISSFKEGLRDIDSNPIGDGVGSAGPASIYNAGKSQISENYYIQLAQEVGWIGLALFITINCLVGLELWRRKTDALASILLASLVGLAVVNLFSHAWTDDTIAYLWWGLAGLALVTHPDKASKA